MNAYILAAIFYGICMLASLIIPFLALIYGVISVCYFWRRYFNIFKEGKAQAIRTKMVLLFDEDSLKQEILGLFIHEMLIQTSN
jgi:hypothetical protein